MSNYQDTHEDCRERQYAIEDKHADTLAAFAARVEGVVRDAYRMTTAEIVRALEKIVTEMRSKP